MSSASRHKQRKHRVGYNIIMWVLTIAVVGGAVAFLVTKYYDDTKDKLEQVSYPQKYSEYVNKAAQDYNLEPALIYAVIRTESNFDPEAQSDAGAMGIMQMMPSSFEWLQTKRGCEGTYTSEDLLKPEICIDYGSYLLRLFYDTYEDERSAVAAYNAGFVVGDWLGDSRYSSDGNTLSTIPYPETSSYVEKVESAKKMYIQLYYS